ncbi:hypothetical protein CHH83_16460 [Bacillus sp. 7586-K]|nr:hypothetical protein CHH83_16460 [Bacillus sp. 7586-K]
MEGGLSTMSHNPIDVLKETLISQLVFLEENSSELMDTYFASEREKYRSFCSSYTSEVESYLSLLNNQLEKQSSLTKVFIGSKVSVKFEDDEEIEEFVICFPEETDPDNGFISFLSPVGHQLLLRSLGETMSLSTPGGEVRVTINDISF